MLSEQETRTNDFDCAACRHEQIVVEAADTATCRSCQRSYLLIVREGFTMNEWNGWATRIAFHVADDPTSSVANG